MGGKVFGHYFYHYGINPKELRVGNIVWDYRLPTQYRPYQHGEPGEDLLDDEEFFSPVNNPNVDIRFANPKEFSLGIGMEGVAWLGPSWKDEVAVHITADEMTEAHVLRYDRFDGPASLDYSKLNDCMEAPMKMIFAVESMASRFFRRPHLWLCTGIVTINKGTCEVTHTSTKSLKLDGSDPTGSMPVGMKMDVGTTPSSTLKMGIASKTIIAAQWMLLYCKNLQRRDPPDTPYMVKLTTKYARDTFKGPSSTVTFLSTEYSDISKSEKGNVQLYYMSDNEDDYSDDESDESDKASEEDKIEGATAEDNVPTPGLEEGEKQGGYAELVTSIDHKLERGNEDADKEASTAEASEGVEIPFDVELLMPRFPEPDSEELREFEKALKLLE